MSWIEKKHKDDKANMYWTNIHICMMVIFMTTGKKFSFKTPNFHEKINTLFAGILVNVC